MGKDDFIIPQEGKASYLHYTTIGAGKWSAKMSGLWSLELCILFFGCHCKIFSRFLTIHLLYWIDVILVFPVVHKSDFVYVWAMPSPGQLQCFNGTLLISVIFIKMLYWHEILFKLLYSIYLHPTTKNLSKSIHLYFFR